MGDVELIGHIAKAEAQELALIVAHGKQRQQRAETKQTDNAELYTTGSLNDDVVHGTSSGVASSCRLPAYSQVQQCVDDSGGNGTAATVAGEADEGDVAPDELFLGFRRS